MKAKIERMGALAKALGPVCKLAHARVSLPVLSTVLVDCRRGGVLLRGTDMDCWLDVEFSGAAVEDPGCVAVSARQLAGVLDAMDGDGVMELTGAGLRLTEERGSVVLPVVAAEEFPEFPDVGHYEVIELDASGLRDALKAVLPAVSVDESRYVLNGVAFDRTGDGKGDAMAPLEVVATDGKRVATDAVAVSMSDFRRTVVVPTDAVECLLRLLPESGAVRLEVGEKLARVGLGGCSAFACKLVEGVFPAWRKVFPDHGDEAGIPVDASGLLDAMGLARFFGDCVEIAARDGRLAINARDDDKGDLSLSLPLDMGNGWSRKFNRDFFADGLKLFAGRANVLGFFGASPTSAATLQEGTLRYVLMPMSTEG